MHLPSVASLPAALVALCLSHTASAAPASTTSSAAGENTYPNGKYSYYKMPTPGAGPCDITTGPDGAIWVQDILVDKIARIDQSTGAIEEFAIPYTEPASRQLLQPLPDVGGRTAFACAIQPGDDGRVYFATGLRNQFGRIDPATRKVEVFTPPNFNPAGDLQPFNDLYRYPGSADGKGVTPGMFFTMTSAGKLVHFDYNTTQFRQFTVPTGAPAGVLGVFTASDGLVYVAETLANKLARFDPRTAKFEEFPLPLANFGPAVIRAETQGRYVWFTGFLSGSLGRFDMRTKTVKVYSARDPLSFPAEDTVDAQGRVWFSTAGTNTLNYIDSSNGKLVSFPQPDATPINFPVSIPPFLDIAMHYHPPTNSMWFAGITNNRVASLVL